MNDEEDEVETVMKANLRSCISTASDRAQLIIAKKITINFTLCSQGASSRGKQKYYQNVSMQLTHLQRMLLNTDFIPGHHTPSSELRAVLLRYRTETIFSKINALMYLLVDMQGVLLCFCFQPFLLVLLTPNKLSLFFLKDFKERSMIQA